MGGHTLAPPTLAAQNKPRFEFLDVFFQFRCLFFIILDRLLVLPYLFRFLTQAPQNVILL